MRFYLASLVVLLLLTASFSLHAGLYDPRHQWKTVKTEHFAIHYYEGEEEIVKRYVTITEQVYATLSKKFDARPWGRTEVVITDQEDSANGFTMVLPYNLIILRVVAPLPDSNLADYDDWFRELFFHEYTHVLHITDTRYPAKGLKFLFGKLIAPNGMTPGWVTEGMATYVETVETGRGRGRSSFTEMLLRTDILRGQFLKLDQMAGSQYSWPSWMAQYLYGVAFWEYLSETYGEEKVTEFSHRYGASLWFYSLNHQAKKVFGKSFYTLWKEWKATLEARYGVVKEEVEKQGLREGMEWFIPKQGESFAQPLADGKRVAYLATSIHHTPELRLRDLETGKEKVLLKNKKDIGQLGFSPDGKSVVYSRIGLYKRFYQYSDLHEIDLQSGKTKRLTKGKRVRDPDFSPDGKTLVCVVQEAGYARLAFYDLEKKALKQWGNENPKLGTEFHNPRWSPDGRWIAVSVFEPNQPRRRRGVEGEAPSGLAGGGNLPACRGGCPEGTGGAGGDVSPYKGQTNLWLVDPQGHRKKITSSIALETRPIWDPKGGSLYYASDQDGIANLYRYDLATGRPFKVTNLLTGAFAPTVLPTGEVAFQYYNGRGFEIRRLMAARGGSVSESFATAPSSDAGRRLLSSRRDIIRLGNASADAARIASPLPPLAAHDYSPFRKLLVPRYLMPNGAFIDNALFLSATVGSMDPLERHRWFGDVNFRSDNQFVGYDFGYDYNRFTPSFFVGNSLYSVNFGNLFALGDDFFEKRLRTYGGVQWSFLRQRFSISYFFEDRSEESGLPPGTTLRTLGNYSGVNAQYRIATTRRTQAAISTEGGSQLTLNGELTDQRLGASSNLEQQVVWADSRTYVSLGRHHVLAFRGAGGSAFGDRLIQGNFGLGGSIGEGPFTGTSTRVFTLRGLPLVTFSRDRVWVASAEYRFPLFYVERGVGTLPFAVNAAHFALFADLGDAYTRTDPSSRPLLGVGAELKGEFVLGYYLPVTGRLGYGMIVINRDRVAGLTDSLTGADIRNGVLILELGTSF